MAGPIYYPDVSSYQPGIDLAGWLAVMAKASEGTWYRSGQYATQKTEAARHGGFFGAYHFLHQGNATAQADFCQAITGNGVPVMVDAEPTAGVAQRMLESGGEAAGTELTGEHVARLQRVSEHRGAPSNPSVGDVCGFVDRFRARGGTVHLAYLPYWYWVQLGQPSLKPLADRALHLVTSNYCGLSPENSSHPGWASYGGMPPVTTLQYTSTASVGGAANCDLNCCRGSGSGDQAKTLTELKNLWRTGSLAGTPPAPGPPAFPYPASDYLGPASPDPHCHSGYYTADRPHIAAWQEQMRRRGWTITADGIFGDQSVQVARGFQAGKGLTADGRVGPVTWQASWAAAVT